MKFYCAGIWVTWVTITWLKSIDLGHRPQPRPRQTTVKAEMRKMGIWMYFPLSPQWLAPVYVKETYTKQGGPVPASGQLSLPYLSPVPAPKVRQIAYRTVPHLQDSDLAEHHLPCNYKPKEKVLSSLWHEQTLESDIGFKFHTLHFAFHQTSTGGLWQWSSDAGYNVVLIISTKMKGVKKKIM